ncbi:DUF1642 domain-containing protein [Streptococcus dysgalactiae]|uniref:DUF1642 domain-containing protein n=1 Tax=Streptococcus dysgalactiae TaxID=1334 RepID=UPI0039834B57
MNIEEAKKKVEKYSFYPQDPKNNVIDVKTVLDIIDKIEGDLQKLEIPQCAADWYEGYIRTLINMHQFGYTIKKEKLYTVEIPNTNIIGNEHTVLMKNGFGQFVMRRVCGDDWRTDKGYQITESEIRKDFKWAWEWAEEVAE